MSPRALVHPERATASPWLIGALTVAVSGCTAIAGQAVAQGELTGETGALAGIAVAVLSLLGLRSISPRLIAYSLVGVSVVVLVRFGIGGSLAGEGQLVLAWMVSAVVSLVLAHRVSVDRLAPLGGSEPAVAARTRPLPTARSAIAVAAVAILAAVLLAPLLLPYVGEDTEAGQGASLDPTQDGAAPLRSSEQLDMTRRPSLTDAPVLTIRSDAATFWRGETFDVWDGRRWTRSDRQLDLLPAEGRIRNGPDDLGARGDDVVVQRVQVEAAFAEVVYAAPSAVSLEIDRPVRQRADGTVRSAPMGEGTVYTVTSRREPLSAERLRAVSGDVPAAVLEQYAQPPEATDRVAQAALEVTEGIDGDYDKVIALEEWMGERVEYSLEAPLAPVGVDVVDHFLFEAEQGWCEQIASSLVVLARLNGLPARLVTGYVPAERNPVTGDFTVRERDAHAWAEVWFPEVGWVPFDPTADVPLAGNDAREPTVAEWLVDHAVLIVLALAAVALLAGPVRALVRRGRARRAARPVGWAAIADHRLAALGARVGRERRADETAESYARAVAARLGDDRLVFVGRVLDDVLYDPSPPDDHDRATADVILDALERAPAPDPVPA